MAHTNLDTSTRRSVRPLRSSLDSGGARFLALGDSYTIGEGVAPSASWPACLADLGARHGLAIAEPRVVARTGWTTDELAEAIGAAGLHGTFELVTLLIGVNDQYRGRDAEDYRPRFHELLVRAIELAGDRAGRVVVGSIPDWGVTPFARGRERETISAEIDAYNRVNREAAAELGSRYVDVTEISRRRGAEHAMLADDGLHPSALMYAEWARLTLPAAVSALRGG